MSNVNAKSRIDSPIKLTFIVSLLIAVLYNIFGPIASFAFILLPLAAFAAVRLSTVFVIAFILFSYFRLHEAFPVLMPLKIPKLLALASLLGIAWHLFISKRLIPFWHQGHTVFVIFFCWITICVLCASNRAEAISYWSSTLTKVFIMVFVISWWINDSKMFVWVRIGIIFSGIAVACVTAYNKLSGIGLVEGTRVTISRELQSQLGDPNDLSLVLLFPISFLCAELMNPTNKKMVRFLALLGLALLCYGIIATQSRGGLLGMLAVFGFFVAQKVKNPMVLLSLGGAAASILLVLAGISDRQSGGAAEEGVDESAMGRLYAWQAAFNMALSNPLTGVGINNFFVNYFFYSPHWDGKNHAVHSTWFQVLGEMGFVGFTLFIVMISSIYRSLRRCYLLCTTYNEKTLFVNVNALLAGLAGFVTSGTFLTQAFTWPIYIILSLTIALETLLVSRVSKT